MSEYKMNKQDEKKAGIVRGSRGEITINQDHDFGIIEYLAVVRGFDVETSKVYMGPFDIKTHIKIFETIKH